MDEQNQNQLLKTAEVIAPGWERQRPFVERVCAPVREWMIRELAPRAGDTVLELAAGAGDTGYEAAEIIGGDGRLLSTDFSPAMLEVARRRATELGVKNVDHLVVDAAHIELKADSVDAVLCRLGYMLMADPAAALRETRRVLRSGGHLALAVWASPDRNPFFTAAVMALVQGGHMPPPDPAEPGIFSMADEERTRDLLGRAGFESIRVEVVPVSFDVAGVDEYMTVTTDTAGPIAMVVRGLSGEERRVVEAGIEQALDPFRGDDGYQVPGAALAAVAS